MRIVVTGAGGFLGCHLVPRLADAGYEVIASSSQKPSHLRSRWGVELDGPVAGSVAVVPPERTTEVLGEAGRIDVLIHGAFPRNLGGSQLGGGLDYNADLFAAADAAGVPLVVNVSSQSVYDAKRVDAASESSPLVLDTPYATAKYATEVMAARICSRSRVVNARLASLIGVGFDQRVVNKMVLRAADGHGLTVKGVDQAFGFMDVRDAADALIAVSTGALRQGRGDQSPNDVVNIGVNGDVSLRSIALLVADIARQEIGTSVAVDESEAVNPTCTSALDVSRLATEYGFSAKINLEETVRDLFRALS